MLALSFTVACLPRVAVPERPPGLLSRRMSVCSTGPDERSEVLKNWKDEPSGARQFKTGPAKGKKAARAATSSRTNIDPYLERAISKQPGERGVVLVTFPERVAIPRFPALVDSLPLGAAVNQMRVREAAALIASLRARRETEYRQEAAALSKIPGARILERFWLAPVFAVEMPLGAIHGFVARAGAVAVEAAVAADNPPECIDPVNGDDLDDVAAALEVIRSEPYRTTTPSSVPVALLDSGVWTGHKLLEDARLGILADCVNGGPDCLDATLPGFDPGDQVQDDRGHGTSSAAILVGTAELGLRWRGGLDHELDSYRVFASGTCPPLNACFSRLAFGRALQHAVGVRLSRVIVANCVANDLDDIFGTCSLAEGAYLAGAVVVAAVGNKGPLLATVGAPAAAPKVFGIGARPIDALGSTEEAQSSGPVECVRQKPEVQGPTKSETAAFSECSNPSRRLRVLGGTSGSTPYAGVAATLLRDWMKSGQADLDPGHVYAGLVLSGRNHGAQVSVREGAGLLTLPTNCCTYFGVENVYEGTTREISIDLTNSDADRLEVGIWWPESQILGEPDDTPLRHSDVDLRILDPDDVERARSQNVWTVFERATAPIEGRRGVWKIQIVGGDFWAGGRDGGFPSPDVVEAGHSERVYWAAAARRPGEAAPP